MNLLKLLLYPFAALYNGVMRFRNHLYDIGHKPSFDFDIAVIAVGNLNIGGSGKTPMVEYLVTLIGDQYPTVVLSRGYKRETTGYRVAGDDDTAASIGDEPLQLYQKFGKVVKVAVGEDRVYAIPQILHEYPDTKVLLLDDAMQQRSIRPALTILLTAFEKPFFKDFVLPFGRLREARVGASRANVVVVTKCDASLLASQREAMTNGIRRYAGEKPVFFTQIAYGTPEPYKAWMEFSPNVIIVSGIANATPLVNYCQERFKVLHHFRFGDHHRYTIEDLREINQYCEQQTAPFCLLSTEKDLVKLGAAEFSTLFDRWKWFSLPIRHAFGSDGAKFDEQVLSAIRGATSSNP